MLPYPRLLIPAVLLVLATPAAAAPQVPCAAAEADSIDIDGMLDDWHGVARTRVGGTDADASFDLRCLVDGDRLYLAVDVRDERVLRQARFEPRRPDGHDRLELTLPGLALTLVPGVDRIPPVRLLGGRKLTDKAVRIEDTLQPKGWSVELSLPLRKVTGWSAAAPTIATTVRLLDSDVPRLAVVEHEVVWDGGLVAGETVDLLAGLLAETRLTKAQITLDARADVDHATSGPERVVAGGDMVALLTDRYGFVKLPVERPADVQKVELIDLRGDGTRVIAAQVRQRGGGGSRELLLLWGGKGGALQPLGTIELGKERAGKKLHSTWKVEPAAAWKQARGARRVLVVTAGPAVGWDEDSYSEAVSDDAEPVHLPWDDDRVGGVFWLKGDALTSAPINRNR